MTALQGGTRLFHEVNKSLGTCSLLECTIWLMKKARKRGLYLSQYAPGNGRGKRKGNGDGKGDGKGVEEGTGKRDGKGCDVVREREREKERDWKRGDGKRGGQGHGNTSATTDPISRYRATIQLAGNILTGEFAGRYLASHTHGGQLQ